jgi:hypothetical protein
VSAFLQPASERTYFRVMRLGMTLQMTGVVALSLILFTKIPILLTLGLSVGAFLIALGLLAWFWGLIWGRG